MFLHRDRFGPVACTGLSILLVFSLWLLQPGSPAGPHEGWAVTGIV